MKAKFLPLLVSLLAAIAPNAWPTTLAAVVAKNSVTLASDSRVTHLLDSSDYGTTAKILVIGPGAVAFSGIASADDLFNVSGLVSAACLYSDAPKERAARFAPGAKWGFERIVSALATMPNIPKLISMVWFCGMEDGDAVVYVVTTKTVPCNGQLAVVSDTLRYPRGGKIAPDQFNVLISSEDLATIVPKQPGDEIRTVRAIVQEGIDDPRSLSGGDIVTCVVDGSGARLVQKGSK